MSEQYQRSSNPDNLSEQEILELVKFCPICGTPWPRASIAVPTGRSVE